MRGKVSQRNLKAPKTRITPAYAGKSALHSSSGSGGLDHPRLCGEKMPTQRSVEMGLGSPPPMRGKEFADGEYEVCTGITPAYAGKSL